MPQFNRDFLLEILAKYGADAVAWDQMRGDCYEHALAKSSLESLEHFYSILHAPGILADKIPLCPVWPAGTDNANRPPGIALLSEVSSRIATERWIAERTLITGIQDRVAQRTKSMDPKARQKTLDTLITCIGDELLEAKVEKIPVSGQLKAVNTLQNQQDLDRKEKELRAQRDKFELQLTQYRDKQAAALKVIADAKSAPGGLTQATLDKIERELNL